METSIDHLLVDCKNDKIKECLSKLKGTKLDKSLFTKISKETLCDSKETPKKIKLIFLC